MSFRRRPYPEVLDNLLTGILGGVTAESHPFPPSPAGGPPYRYALEKPPVGRVVSVYGSRNDQPVTFKADADYQLGADDQSLEWLPGAQLPDDGSLFHVNYLPRSAAGPLDDIVVGSVTRTLAEAIGLEIARLYAQLEAVYQSGFIDSATGRALDNVVALLGISRIRAGRFSGEVEFTRADGSHGSIFIPAGARVMTADGNVEYATTGAVTLLDGQKTARVTARDVEANPKGLDAGALSVLAKPIAGIKAVTNPAPTGMSGSDETDVELRARAKHFLHGSERATLGALQEAVSRQGIQADVAETIVDGRQVGEVIVTPHAESLPPELRQRILTAIRDARPAGVYVDLKDTLAAPQKIGLKLRLSTSGDLLAQDLRAAQETVRGKIREYLSGLAVQDPGSTNRLIGLVLSVPEIQDVALTAITVDGGPEQTQLPDLTGSTAVLGDLEIVDPNLPTRLQVLIGYPQTANPPDKPAVQALLGRLLTAANTRNAAATPASTALRTLSYGKLLKVVQMAGDPAVAALSAAESDAALLGVLDGSVTGLPAAADLAPYRVQFTFTMESGLSRVLGEAAGAEEAHLLAPFEQVSLTAVETREEVSDG